ncbi:hypothetical protein ACIBJE_21550 [Micromonospora sp. NPDC050187]|uniref:hypothetical protein n=1 Tax=Micromonospora sp. NPDC050187 TaxID=3364277 RepID=UPI0037B32AAC
MAETGTAMQEKPALQGNGGTQGEPEMVSEVMRVWRPAGQGFSRSQKVPGRLSPSTRVPGSKKLSEATLEPLADNEQVVSTDALRPARQYEPNPRSRRREEVENIALDAAAHLTHRLIERGTPILMSFVFDRVIPAATSKAKRAIASRKARRQATAATQNGAAQVNVTNPDDAATVQVCVPPPSVEAVDEVGVDIEVQRPVIGREEARQRRELRRAALLLAAKQERILQQAVVVDDEDLLQLDDNAVTQEKLEADLPLKLEAAPLPASDGRVASLRDVLGAEADLREQSRVRSD